MRPSRSPFQSEGGVTPSGTPQLQNQSADSMPNNAALQQGAPFGINPMAMGN